MLSILCGDALHALWRCFPLYSANALHEPKELSPQPLPGILTKSCLGHEGAAPRQRSIGVEKLFL